MIKKTAFIFFMFVGQALFAQELNCIVKINADQIQGTQDRVFETLEKALFEFMNNRRWTTDNFKDNERIECSIFITLSERVSNNRYKGTIQINSRRPVYGSSYYSPMFNFFDGDLEFEYLEFAPLDFNISTNLDNLTSVMAFYAYLIIGLDYDSYSLQGGTPYYQLAQRIVNNAQGAPEKGWKAFESDRNRYWMAENLLNDFFSPLRECLYNYHLKGFDTFHKDVDAGRKTVLNSLQGLQKIHNVRPSSFALQFFFNAKSDEVVNLLSEALPGEQQQMQVLLTKIDPGNAAKYEKIGKK
jgi:hypothetical protein